jgi:glycine/D-amino acid oxidase-like deaminating enzyme
MGWRLDGPVDLIIVGGGVVGLAAAYQAARRGHSAVLLEKRGFFHEDTASAGASRQFRVQYSDPAVTRLVLASMPLWAELQGSTDEDLAVRTGSLWFGDPRAPGAEGRINAVLDVMTSLDVPFDWLSAQDVMRQYAFADIPDRWTGFWQPDGAATNVKATLRAFHRVVQASPHVTLMTGHQVVGVRTGPGGVSVDTAGGATVHGGKLIVTAGPETNSVLRLLGFELDSTTWTMVSAYFRTRRPGADLPTWINFQSVRGTDPGLYYGFPELAWDRPGFVRVGANYPSHVRPEPEAPPGQADQRVVGQLGNWVRAHMPWLIPTPVDPSTCICGLLTQPGHPGRLARELVLDFAPEHVPGNRDVVICATGWVFKIAPLLGEICVDLALKGHTTHDISAGALEPHLWRRWRPSPATALR